MRRFEEMTQPESCLNKARRDEMMFVLLGRDICAPAIIRAWCAARIEAGKNSANDYQILEALECARIMESEKK